MAGRNRISLTLYLCGIAGLPLATPNAYASPRDSAGAPALPSEIDGSRSGNAGNSSLVDRERQLIETGYRLRQQGRDADAFGVYREAYELRHDTKPLAQMALALEALGNWSQAYLVLRQALADRSHLWIEANRTLLEGELSRIGQKLGRLTLVIQPAGAAVRINGSPVGAAPFNRPLLLNPGSSTVEVELAGYAPYRSKFEIEPGKQYREIVRLTRRNEAPGPKSPTYVVAPPRRNPLWLGTAVGGALVATAAVIPWSIANHKVDQLAKSCNASQNCLFDETSADVHGLDRATNALLLSGLGIAVTSIVLYLSVPQAAPEGSTSVTAFANRDSALLLFGGRY